MRVAPVRSDGYLFLWWVLFRTGSLGLSFFFFLIDPAPTEIYPLPLPDALPISRARPFRVAHLGIEGLADRLPPRRNAADRAPPVRDAEEVDARCDRLGPKRDRREREIAAVAAPRHHHASRIHVAQRREVALRDRKSVV